MSSETRITAGQLERAGACRDVVLRFCDLFGDEVRVTEALARKHSAEFDWDWAAHRLLRTATAREAYEKAKTPAWEAYEKATATAWARAYLEQAR